MNVVPPLLARSVTARDSVVVLSLLLLAGIGCAPRPGIERREPDDPASSAVTAAAEAALFEYGAALADVARQTARRAAQFDSHTAAVDFGAAQNKAARDRIFAPAFAEVNARLLGSDAEHPKPYDPLETQHVFEELALGFERAAARRLKKNSGRSD